MTLCCVSGCTSLLWNTVNPEERVWIPANQITEAELKKRGIEYEKCEGMLQGYLVRKSKMQRLRDYTVLTLATPITVALDGAFVVVCFWAVIKEPSLLNMANTQSTSPMPSATK